MRAKDFDLICAALAFAVVAINGENLTKDGAQRATGLAYLIKEFCRTSVPDAFAEMTANEADKTSPLFAIVNRMTTAIANIMRENDMCLPHDLIAKGFKLEEIDRHWAIAKALAHVELNMMDA